MSRSPLLLFGLALVACDDKTPEDTAAFEEDTAVVEEAVDIDGDGYAAIDAGGTDCDDENGEVNPGASEVCDEIDDDCDGAIDEGALSTFYADGDGDGYGGDAAAACEQPAGHVAAGGDCDDADPAVNPAAVEICNDIDDDCDGRRDAHDAVGSATWYQDLDADGYGDDEITASACAQPGGFVSIAGDCDDGDPAAHDGAAEVCDGVDNDCDGEIDDGAGPGAWYADADGDGYGDSKSTVDACEQPSGYVADATDCDDGEPEVNPDAEETCWDGLDNDCDGVVDRVIGYADLDGDGYGDPASAMDLCSGFGDLFGDYIEDDSDCDDADANTYPGAEELCDGSQNDCDTAWTEADEVGLVSWFDSDGLGADASATFSGGVDGAPAVWSASADGGLQFCEGTWYVNLDTGGDDVSVTGLGGSGSTVLDGGDSGSVISSEGALSLTGLTLTGGYADYGGGLYQVGDSATLDDVLITGNEALIAGGGLYVADTADWSSFTDVEISYNAAGSYGGGAAIDSVDVTFTDSAFTENSAGSGYGGGLTFSYGELELVDTDFTANEAVSAGGLYAYTSEVTMSGGAIADHTTTEHSAAGYLWGHTDFIADGVTIQDNTSGTRSVLLLDENAEHSYTDCTFTDNTGDEAGVFTFDGEDAWLGFTSSDFSGNNPYDAYISETGYDFGTEATGSCEISLESCY